MSSELTPSDQQEIRYALPDQQKFLLTGESKAIFGLIERRFGVEILSCMPGLAIKAPAGDNLPGAVAFLNRLKIGFHHGQPAQSTRGIESRFTYEKN